jgi:hypothetical protein
VTDGSNPPICHIHTGRAGGIAQPNELDEIKILQKLARDSDPRVRLRAVDLLIDLKAKAKTEPAKQDDSYEEFFDALTEDELARFDDLLGQIKALKETVYARAPQLRPLSSIAPREVPPQTSAEEEELPEA